MFVTGDIVSVQTAEILKEYPYGRNSIGGLFPINRHLYEVLADLGNEVYVIGIGNIAIAAVRCDTLRLETAKSAWEPVFISGTVGVRFGARNYMGYPLPSYVYEQKYEIANIMYDRVVLRNEEQTLAVKGEDVI